MPETFRFRNYSPSWLVSKEYSGFPLIDDWCYLICLVISYNSGPCLKNIRVFSCVFFGIIVLAQIDDWLLMIAVDRISFDDNKYPIASVYGTFPCIYHKIQPYQAPWILWVFLHIVVYIYILYIHIYLDNMIYDPSIRFSSDSIQTLSTDLKGHLDFRWRDRRLVPWSPKRIGSFSPSRHVFMCWLGYLCRYMWGSYPKVSMLI